MSKRSFWCAKRPCEVEPNKQSGRKNRLDELKTPGLVARGQCFPLHCCSEDDAATGRCGERISATCSVSLELRLEMWRSLREPVPNIVLMEPIQVCAAHELDHTWQSHESLNNACISQYGLTERLLCGGEHVRKE
jgi:hypothetical protein